MAQLAQGGFCVTQMRTGVPKNVGYVYVEQLDLNHKVEHWVLITDHGQSPAEGSWRAPQPDDQESDATIVGASADGHSYANVAAFLEARYNGFVGSRQYIRCDCVSMS